MTHPDVEIGKRLLAHAEQLGRMSGRVRALSAEVADAVHEVAVEVFGEARHLLGRHGI